VPARLDRLRDRDRPARHVRVQAALVPALRQVECLPEVTTQRSGLNRIDIFNNDNFVQAGDFSDLFRRDAELADKILRGTKPGDIPSRAADEA
jgi:hypothetical protein